MRILALDTTASPVSAALLKDGFLEGEFFLNIKTTHSQTLMPVVEALLRMTGTSIADIDLFVVDAGPGSFTGVRIGVASVKGMTMPDNKPCAAVSTLEAMAYMTPYRNGIVCPVMDARRSQVYNALFSLGEGEPVRLCEDRALSTDELEQELLTKYKDSPVYLVGDGAELCYRCFGEKNDNIILVPMNIRFQHAYGTAKAAEAMAAREMLCSSDELVPFYLRLPQAERELKARLQGGDPASHTEAENSAPYGVNREKQGETQ